MPTQRRGSPPCWTSRVSRTSWSWRTVGTMIRTMRPSFTGPFGQIRAPTYAGGKAERIVVAGVLWPAKAFQTDFDEAALTTAHAGDALAAPSGAAGVADLSEQDFKSLLSEFNTFMGASGAATIAAARTAAKGLTASASQALVRHGAAAVSIDVESPDTELAGDAAPIARAQVEPTNAQLLLSNLVQPPAV